jgi:hypothetical protein
MLVLEHKNTKKVCQQQNIWKKIARFQTILVISQAILQKTIKSDQIKVWI